MGKAEYILVTIVVTFLCIWLLVSLKLFGSPYRPLRKKKSVKEFKNVRFKF